MKRAFLVAPLIALGCTTDTEAPEVKTQGQPLGESTQAYYFSGIGAGEMPTMQERVAIHLMNRVRTAPYVWNIQDMDSNPVPPLSAMTYQPFFAEAGRWQGSHAIQYQCFCNPGAMPAPQDYNSCCELGLKNGEVQCVGPIVTCSEGTEEQDRWALLNRGPGQISQEYFWNGDLPPALPTVPGEIAADFVVQNLLGALFNPRDKAAAMAQVNTPIVPQECQPQFEPCAEGVCTDIDSGANACDIATNPQCLGVCQGTGLDTAPPCVLNAPLDPVACDPANFTKAFYWTFAFGASADPVPTLSDGVGYQPGFTATEENPAGTFGAADPGEVEFAVRYHNPVGRPQSLKLALNGSCFDLDVWTEPPTELVEVAPAADMGVDAGNDDPVFEEREIWPYTGLTYTTVQGLGPGCYRFFYSATDAEGFVFRYPSLGSLGVAVDAQGMVNLQDDACPGWAPDVPPVQCLPVVDECNSGEERPCYSGRAGTQDKGICAIGTESCEQGRWSGKCEGEVRPELTESCGDSLDNNCNGLIDENCPIPVDPPDPVDMGMDDEDMGDDTGPIDPGTTKGGSDDEGCGCTTVETPKSSASYGWLSALLLGLVAFRLRRK